MAKSISYINTTTRKNSSTTRQQTSATSTGGSQASSSQSFSKELESINKALQELKTRVDAIFPKLDAITSESDLNDYTKPSHIFVPADITVANRPDASPESDAYLDVETLDGQIFQTYSSTDGIFKACRIRYEDSWKAWSRLDNFGCNTITALADKMGNEASESEEIAALWGQTKEGKMVRILNQPAASIIGNLLYGADTAKELATVVAGVEPLSLLFGATIALNRGYNSLDDINTNSVMYVASSFGLSNTPFSYCMVMTFIYGMDGMQTAISIDRNEMAFRGKIGGKWNDWMKVDATSL